MLFAATFHASNLDQYPKNTIVSPIEAAHAGEAAEPAGQLRDRVADPRVAIKALTRLGTRVMTAVGCQPDIAAEIAEHLVDADLSGVYSYGIFRLDWCAERAAAGRFNPGRPPACGSGRHDDNGAIYARHARAVGALRHGAVICMDRSVVVP